MFDDKLMRSLCIQTQESLLKSMKMTLHKFGYKIKATPEYIIAEGRDPICLLAHLDTVGSAPPTAIYYDKEEQVMWSPQLLGADDRAGVYAILRVLQDGFRPHIVFTTDEEKGAIGAGILAQEHSLCPFKKKSPVALVQLDRRGSRDSVFYDCDNPEFEKWVNSFGFKTAIGTFSDISVIAPVWGIAAVNLSVGYYNEHQLIETLHCIELEQTIKKVRKMCAAAANITPFEYIEAEGSLYYNYFKYTNPDKECVFCQKPVNKKTGKFVKANYYNYWVCKECEKKYYAV